jgi:hypothetical protein
MAFNMVAALWVTPDFAEGEAGRRQPPRVNHSKVDYPALASFIEELFPYGPRPRIQVPNDTIDQVTIHMRQLRGVRTGVTMRCEDFGQALLTQAKGQKGSVVDVRSAWDKLHFLPNRDAAPPPMVIPFVATFTDFEDAMIWMVSTRPSFGLQPIDILATSDERGAQQNLEGTLSPEALKRLEDIFGTPFSPPALLDRMASDAPPAYA